MLFRLPVSVQCSYQEIVQFKAIECLNDFDKKTLKALGIQAFFIYLLNNNQPKLMFG